METVLSAEGGAGNTESVLAEGLRLIDESPLSGTHKWISRTGWTHWVEWCSGNSVDPLDATWEQVLECLDKVQRVENVKAALRCVYRARGLASPSDDRRLLAALGTARNTSVDSFAPKIRKKVLLHISDYLAWCHVRSRRPAPASAEQVVEFLSSIASLQPYSRVQTANVALSVYLMEQGHPPMGSHPLVVDALRGMRAASVTGKPVARGVGKQAMDLHSRYERQWDEWRDSQGIESGGATAGDVLRFLKGYEHQATAGRRLRSLRASCGDEEPALRSPEVQEWLNLFDARVSRGDAPGNRAAYVSRVQPVLDEWSSARAARASAGRRIPVGLTREEVERVRVGQGRQLEPSTVRNLAYSWADFSGWRESRNIPLESVEPVHIRVYLEESAETLAVATLWRRVDAIAFGFDEHGFPNNPAVADEVLDFMNDLAAERKEAPTQVDPVRFADLQAILGSAFEPLFRESAARAEVRGVLTVSLLRLMYDGLLRGSEAVRARWRDLSRSVNGTGSLLLPRSKVDKLGRGECTYVSAFALQHLDLLRDLRRFYGKAVGDDDLIFEVSMDVIRSSIHKGCAAVGLEGNFGAHSLRVGAAQDLAIEGFSLPMIMLAGRWKSPAQPGLYIRHITVSDSAMAQLQAMLATEQHRLGPDARGPDVMSRLDLVRSAR